MRYRHTKNLYPRRPYKTMDDEGRTFIVYFEKNPNALFTRENVESFSFKALLLKQYEYRARGIGRKHYSKLLNIKFQWETGGMSPPRYVPAPCFMALGRALDLSKDEVTFRHKDYTAYPQFMR